MFLAGQVREVDQHVSANYCQQIFRGKKVFRATLFFASWTPLPEESNVAPHRGLFETCQFFQNMCGTFANRRDLSAEEFESLQAKLLFAVAQARSLCLVYQLYARPSFGLRVRQVPDTDADALHQGWKICTQHALNLMFD